MASNTHLFNAAVVGENPEAAFLLQGDYLHAVDTNVAMYQNDKKAEDIFPLLKDALHALINFSKGKVEAHFLEFNLDPSQDHFELQSEIVQKIYTIYSHLPHHDRNELSSLIHHKPSAKQK